MKAQCLICAERFVQSSVISATSCGHLFHHGCLLQWHERSKTCPNCRTKLDRRDVVAKLFLDSPEEGDSTISDENDAAYVAALRNENSDLVAQFRESNNAKHDLIEDGKLKDYRLAELENELRRSADTLDQNKRHYKVKLANLHTRLEAAEMELVVTKKELKTYSGLHSMLEGSSSRTEQILKSYSKDPASLKHLATYCSVLQKELTDTSDSKAKLQEKVKGLKSDLAAAHDSESEKNSLITTLRAENATLTDSLKASEQRLESVNKKIESFQNKVGDQGKSRDIDLDSSIFLQINRLERRVMDKDHVLSSHLKSDENKLMKMAPATYAVETSHSVIELSSTSSEEHYCENFNIIKRSRCPASLLTYGAGGGAYSSPRSRDGGHDGHSKPDVFPSERVGIGARRKVPIKKKNSIKVPKSSTDIKVPWKG